MGVRVGSLGKYNKKDNGNQPACVPGHGGLMKAKRGVEQGTPVAHNRESRARNKENRTERMLVTVPKRAVCPARHIRKRKKALLRSLWSIESLIILPR